MSVPVEEIEEKNVVITYVNGLKETYLLAAENVQEKMATNLRSEENKKWLRIEGKFINLENVLTVEIKK